MSRMACAGHARGCVLTHSFFRANAERRAEKVPGLEAALNAEKARADAAEAKLRQDKLDTARKMKAKGFSADDIAELTGLTADEIKATTGRKTTA